jgi:hypothetical protein
MRPCGDFRINQNRLPQRIDNALDMTTTPRTARWFFPLSAAVLLLAVCAGFGTRALGVGGQPGATVPDYAMMPAYIYWHAAVLLAWILLYLTQTLLVASGRTAVHRTLGPMAGLVAVMVVATSVLATQRAIAHSAIGAPLADVPVVFFNTVAGIVHFGVLVAAGLRFRHKPETHRRLMYCANLPVLTPALARIPGLIDFPPILIMVPLLALGALVAMDLVTLRKLHPATLWGGIVALIAERLVAVPLGFSEIGRKIVDALA